MTDGPIWECTNLKNTFGFKYIINGVYDQEVCVYADESLQLNPIDCNQSTSFNFICQKCNFIIIKLIKKRLNNLNFKKMILQNHLIIEVCL